jgi:hypothetical protein
MWPTYERNNDKVVDNMRAVIDDLMAAVNKRVL